MTDIVYDYHAIAGLMLGEHRPKPTPTPTPPEPGWPVPTITPPARLWLRSKGHKLLCACPDCTPS
jgi:hypothetical protein